MLLPLVNARLVVNNARPTSYYSLSLFCQRWPLTDNMVIYYSHGTAQVPGGLISAGKIVGGTETMLESRETKYFKNMIQSLEKNGEF